MACSTVSSATDSVTRPINVPFSTKPNGVRPPVWRTAARAKGMMSSIDFDGLTYDGKRGAGYLLVSALCVEIAEVNAKPAKTANQSFPFIDIRPESLFCFRCRIEILKSPGFNFLHHLGKRLPGVFRVFFVLSRNIDSGNIWHPIFAEHVVGIAVTRCQRAQFRCAIGCHFAFVNQGKPSVLGPAYVHAIRQKRVVNMPPMVLRQTILLGEIDPCL